MTDWPETGFDDSASSDDDSALALSEAVIDEVSGLIEEFGLSHVELSCPTFRVAFGKTVPAQGPIVAAAPVAGEALEHSDEAEEDEADMVPLQANLGIPVTSPMTGIFYSRSNPGAPAFVTEGASVNAGQVVCLIEAMKVFNEIVAPASGTVGRIGPKDGEVVQPGDVLITVLP